MNPGVWTHSNLTTQGYCLSDTKRRELWLGLRFSTGVCLTLVVVALSLQSPVMVLALGGIGVIAGFSARHPFDHLWNNAVRHLVGGPALPPNPPRRRHAFKVTAWLLVVGGLLSAGATTVALVLGGLLVAACATVTATNLCLSSEALAWWQRRTTREKVIAT